MHLRAAGGRRFGLVAGRQNHHPAPSRALEDLAQQTISTGPGFPPGAAVADEETLAEHERDQDGQEADISGHRRVDGVGPSDRAEQLPRPGEDLKAPAEQCSLWIAQRVDLDRCRDRGEAARWFAGRHRRAQHDPIEQLGDGANLDAEPSVGSEP